jgi:hypothetical protein
MTAQLGTMSQQFGASMAEEDIMDIDIDIDMDAGVEPIPEPELEVFAQPDASPPPQKLLTFLS